MYTPRPGLKSVNIQAEFSACAVWMYSLENISSYYCCRSERALSERARQQTKIVQLLKISILLEPQSMLVESHFTNMQRAAIRAAI